MLDRRSEAASNVQRPAQRTHRSPSPPTITPACSYTLALSTGAVATALFVGGFVVKSLQED